MTITRKREAGCSVVVLIIIITAANNKMARVRNEAELGDQLLGRVAPPNTRVEAALRTAHSIAPHSTATVTTTPTPKAAHPLPLVLFPS